MPALFAVLPELFYGTGFFIIAIDDCPAVIGRHSLFVSRAAWFGCAQNGAGGTFVSRRDHFAGIFGTAVAIVKDKDVAIGQQADRMLTIGIFKGHIVDGKVGILRIAPIDRCSSGVQLFISLPPLIDGDDRAISLGNHWSQAFGTEISRIIGVIFSHDPIDLIGGQIQFIQAVILAGAENDGILARNLHEGIDMGPVFGIVIIVGIGHKHFLPMLSLSHQSRTMLPVS